jgi:hypothetical protein
MFKDASVNELFGLWILWYANYSANGHEARQNSESVDENSSVSRFNHGMIGVFNFSYFKYVKPKNRMLRQRRFETFFGLLQ